MDHQPAESVSFWWDALGGPPAARPSLSGDRSCDVAIVGAGYTGLWTAYYLARHDPSLRIIVLESRYAGYGASGRNGGWLSAEIDFPHDARLRQAMTDSVDEVLKVCAAEGIEADAVKSGCLRVAVTPAQETRLRAFAVVAADWRLLEPAELATRVRVAGARAAAFTPQCARVQPAALVAGLARAAERAGVLLFEQTPVTGISRGAVSTPHGTVRAEAVVRATEGFTATLPGQRRRWLPMNSSVIVTEPLPASVWSEIGWADAETMSDFAHAYCYLQRTADGRIAIGGRGNPYRYSNGFDPNGHTPDSTVAALTGMLRRLFPAAAEVPVARAWSGVLGVPRDWRAGVAFDQATGFGWAGGYAGHGVTTANLAGRTLAGLITGSGSELADLPWVGHVGRRWEPEPLRWLGVQAMYAAYRHADRTETARGLGHSTRLSRLADLVSGRDR
ncbi:NAD(P)/FAD-dependent oxidoreductase [Trebonia kvetii]|uniref:NAD(P)/FAD-dependent oxidoreductase n=1 Tax=Trebonia kvetii TaxID=2480626 RepID=UPI001651E250|nr:FAD-dependent oxidoreductase [Trebonia kvetii]